MSPSIATRSWLICAALVIAALYASAVAAQPAYPSRPIRFLVGSPAGGSNDIFARAISPRLSDALGQPVVVDNRPGAGQMIAADLTAKATDGHSIFITSTSYTTGAAIQPKLSFDPINDLVGVTMVCKGPMVLVVHPSVPAKSMKELIAIARANVGQLNYGSGGIGNINHLGIEVLKAAAKINMVHVPYKGIAPAITDLIAGQIQVALVSVSSVEPQIKSGRLRAIGVSSPTRSSFMPAVPAIAESVPGYDNEAWWGIFTAGKTPKPVIDRLNAELHKILATDDMKRRFVEFGAEPSTTTPEALNTLVRSEIAKWSKVIKAANINPE